MQLLTQDLQRSQRVLDHLVVLFKLVPISLVLLFKDLDLQR